MSGTVSDLAPRRGGALPRIRVITPWFGPWPAWFGLYLESCRWNPTIDFLIVGDAAPPADLPPNVVVQRIAFSDYRAHIAARLSIRPRWDDPYKLCDLKPALGLIHEEALAGYDLWGYADLDLIYGDIRAIYTRDLLDHDLISSHAHVVCGHFLLMRNTARMRSAFTRIRHWRWLLGAAAHKSFDERLFSMLFLDAAARRERGLHRFLAGRMGGALLREQYSTALPGLPWIDGSQDHPGAWHWREGRLTCDRGGDRQFLYAHFSHWNSRRWLGTGRAAWDGLDPLVRVTGPRPRAFTISAAGFTPDAPASLVA